MNMYQMKIDMEKKYIEQRTSILSVPVERIQETEEKCSELTKENILSAANSRKDVDEIKKIEQVCKDNEIEVTGNVFLRTAAEIKRNSGSVQRKRNGSNRKCI